MFLPTVVENPNEDDQPKPAAASGRQMKSEESSVMNFRNPQFFTLNFSLLTSLSRNLLLLAMAGTVFLVICLCSACTGEYPVSREADLKKYPELAPFILSMKSFQGDRCDLEAGVFRFAYVADFESPGAFMPLFDQRATREGWRIIASSDCSRSYSKNLKRFPAQEKADIVIVSLDPAKSLVRVEWKSG